MKKNNMLRIASVLLVAVLLSTCAISGAFAKYTTSGEATDSARVAKFDATFDVDDVAFFALSETGTVSGSATAYTVYGGEDNEDNLVAPGTSGEASGVAFTGTSEVAVKITYSAVITLTGWTVDGAEYCPIVFTVDDNDYKINAMDENMDSIAELVAAVKNAVEELDAQEFAANTDLSTATISQPAIEWRWDYEGNEDPKDTKLGQADVAPEITIALTATVTQIN